MTRSLLVIVLAGCAHHARAPAPIAPARPAPIADVSDAVGCPMDVPGAKASVAELGDRVALDFTTSGDVLELRRRVRAVHDAPTVIDLDQGVRVTLPAGDPHAQATRAVDAAAALNAGDCTSLSASLFVAPGPNVEMKANRVPR